MDEIEKDLEEEVQEWKARGFDEFVSRHLGYREMGKLLEFMTSENGPDIHDVFKDKPFEDNKIVSEVIEKIVEDAGIDYQDFLQPIFEARLSEILRRKVTIEW